MLDLQKLGHRRLGSRIRLVQIAIESETFLIDALRVSNLAPLRTAFGNQSITKVIHNASFERRILGSVGLELNGSLTRSWPPAVCVATTRMAAIR